ncbi:MAG: family 16 glycosylhydrolase [Pseudomonadota bacterium]
MLLITRAFFAAGLSAAALVCSTAQGVEPSSQTSADAPVALGAGFVDTLETFSEDWYVSDFDQKRESVQTGWRPSQVHHTPPAAPGEAGTIRLTLVPAADTDAVTEKPYIGAGLQLPGPYHYGRYEVVMQAARGAGVVSSFFTYTGPWYGDPHDEIDFEFLGQDTTKVWVTRFADGERLPGKWIDLGYDAAGEPRLYAFEWHPGRIVWYAGETEIFRVEASERTLPVTPGKLIINIWIGNEQQVGWLGRAEENTRAEAVYRCLSFRSFEDDGPQCSDRFGSGS